LNIHKKIEKYINFRLVGCKLYILFPTIELVNNNYLVTTSFSNGLCNSRHS